ncbi:MAG: methionyl-tRNA formyltransferase [Patescibacteria group bacterium]
MQKDENIVFIGGRDRGLKCIKALIEKGEKLPYIFCLEEDDHEKEKYSKQIVALAKKHSIPVKVTKTIKSVTDINLLKNLKPLLIIVMGWRTIIPSEVLKIPKRGVVAVHESLLPKYRGFAPINWAIINGEKMSGVTLFYLDEGIDSGDIIAQRKIPIGSTDTGFTLYQKTKTASVEILIDYLEDIKRGSASRIKQNEKEATYTCFRTPDDGEIFWTRPAKDIYNLIRALSDPYPGAFTIYEGRKIIIQKASFTDSPRNFVGRIPGRVVAVGQGWVEVLTGDGSLKIEEIEVEGKKLPASKIFSSIKGTLGIVR